jgi:HAD superfamily hydrolase (TIGR01509 family)
LRDKGWNEEDVAKGKHARNEIYSSLLSNSSNLSLPGMEEVVQHFSSICRMAIVTSSAREHFERIHEQTSLLKHFELVVAAGDYAQEKPHPEPYLVAMERLQVKARNCIAVEDSPRGLRAALAAELDCVVLRSHLAAKYSFDGAYAVVDSPAELGAVLRQWHEQRSAA